MIFKKTTYAVLLAILLALWWGAAVADRYGIIAVDDLRVRSGPGKQYRVLASVPKGARVAILDKENGWLKIEHLGLTGYILDRPKFIEAKTPATQTPREKSTALKTSAPDTENIDGRMKKVQEQLDKINRREQDVLEDFDAAEEALNRTRRQVRAAEAELDRLEGQINENQQRSAQLEADILDGEVHASKRLVALYKINWVGRVQLLATADSFYDFISRKSALEKILARDEALLEELHEKKMALEVLLTRLNADKAEKRSMELAFKQRARQLDDRQKVRKILLRKIRSKKSLGLAALASLKKAALELDVTLQQIAPAAAVAAPRPAARARRKPFIDYKGLLRWPVKGKIISFFGPYKDKKYAVTNFQSGINIKAERGEPIRSVLGGHTIYASWFKGFGNMMIIDHGNHYYTVYAHLEEVFKVKGDRVEKDEVIATVGDSGSMMGPALHFEVRHHGKPVDPLKWIEKS